MKKTILYLFLSLWIVKPAIAQSNWKPGYLVLHTGDTLSGEINYPEWDYNPKEIEFRHGGAVRVYSSINIKAFEITGFDHYRSARVSYHNSAAELYDAGKFFGDQLINDTIFLRLLYRAPVSLYELKTKRRKYFFVLDETNSATELIYRVRVQDNQLYKDEQFKAQLLGLLKNTQRQSSKINLDRLDYREQDLLRFFKSLYETGEKSQHRRTPAKTDLSAGLAGVLHYGWRVSTYSPTIGWQLGPGITLPAKRHLGRYHIRFGLNLKSQPFKAHYPGDDNRQPFDYRFTFYYIEPQIEFMGSFNPLDKTQFLLGAYLGYNISLKSYINYETDGNINPDPTANPIKGGGIHIGMAGAIKSGPHTGVIHLGWQSDIGAAGYRSFIATLIYRIRIVP